MASVLICTPGALEDELKDTILWRDDVQRQIVRGLAEALAATLARPSLLVVDGALGQAEHLITAVRANPDTRTVSIVLIARGDFDPDEVRFIEAGANAILRLPVSPEWDERLSVLMAVPPRRDSRLAVQLQIEADAGTGIRALAGTVLNLSENGMLVETDIPLTLGSDIDFKIHLRDIPQPLVGCGQVVRQAGGNRSGVRFYGLEGDGPDRVRRFVRKPGR
jgi:DNA-binding response OmpR family regulator